MNLALDKVSNDLIINDDGTIARVSGSRLTIQLVKNRLSTNLGEFVLYPRVGWLSLDQFGMRPDTYRMEAEAKRIILSTEGVDEVLNFTMALGKDRVLQVSFLATFTDGTHNQFNVPWST